MKSGKLSTLLKSIIPIIFFLFSTSVSQIKIKERVEIKPSKSTQPMKSSQSLDIKLPALNMQDFELGNRGGFIYSYDNIYNDRIFIPRIG